MRHNDPELPESWLAFARSDLAMARIPRDEDMFLESLCFHAQQAVEKSIKAVLVFRKLRVPKIHSIEALIDFLPSDIQRTPDLIASATLSEYASNTRYPGFEELVTEEEYHEAVRLAESVVKWAEDLIGA
jgi:HEPN domain-containing protein